MIFHLYFSPLKLLLHYDLCFKTEEDFEFSEDNFVRGPDLAGEETRLARTVAQLLGRLGRLLAAAVGFSSESLLQNCGVFPNCIIMMRIWKSADTETNDMDPEIHCRWI